MTTQENICLMFENVQQQKHKKNCTVSNEQNLRLFVVVILHIINISHNNNSYFSFEKKRKKNMEMKQITSCRKF